MSYLDLGWVSAGGSRLPGVDENVGVAIRNGSLFGFEAPIHLHHVHAPHSSDPPDLAVDLDPVYQLELPWISIWIGIGHPY